MKKDKVDMELIGRYVRGELTPREMYALERQAQDDPMLMDIILGMEAGDQTTHEADMADIRQRIRARAAAGRTKRLATFWRWSAAASVLVAIGVGTLWLVRQPADPTLEMAQTSPTAVEVPSGEAEESTEAPSTLAKEPPVVRDAAASKQVAAPQAAVVDTAPQRIAMQTEKQEPTKERLDEVVVVGYGAQKKSTASGAVARVAADEIDTPAIAGGQTLASRTEGIRVRGIHARPAVSRLQLTEKELAENPNEPTPKDGWDAYRQYLKDAMKLAHGQKGTVDLAFTIDDEGRPTTVTVIGTTNEQLNAFATLIVRDGPRWLPGENDERQVTLRLEF